MKQMADNLEEYIKIVDSKLIIDGVSKEEYDAAMKTVKKLIKHLRNGDGDKVFNKERFMEMKESGNFV